MLLESSARAQAWECSLNLPLAIKNIHVCVCISVMGTSLADTGEGSCAGRQETKGLQEKAGWGVLLGDGDSSVWQSGVFIFGADHTKWNLTVKQGRNLFSLLTSISE